jgi:hypothetical protein
MEMSDGVDSMTEAYSDDIEATGSSSDVVLIVEKTSAERKITRRSWVWRWGIEQGRYWRCQLCIGHSKLYVYSATTHIIAHLKTSHGKSENRSLNNVHTLATDSNDQTTMFAHRQLKKDSVMQLLINWIIRTQQSFSVVEAESFRALISQLNPYAIQYVPKSGDTVRAHAKALFEHARVLLKERLSNARSEIHYSFDLWTSPNCKAMMAVIGHWTAEDYSLKTVLLGIREIHGRHTGNNIGAVLMELIEELNIATKLGYSVTDNAQNNDTALETVSAILLATRQIVYHVPSRRLRCIGHIINLVVKTLLFGAKATEDTDSSSSYDGAIAKLHYIVNHIRITPQRRALYVSEQAASLCSSPDFMVVMDNATRWNSTYNMINAALKLRERIDGYVRLIGAELEEYIISGEEWNDLKELALMLTPFEKVTRATQGNNQGQGSIVSVLLSMDMLLDRLEKIKLDVTSISSAFYATVDAAWSKLNKYYTLTERSTIYVVAIILHPCMKLHYFRRHWSDHPDWIDSARQQMEAVYLESCVPDTTVQTSVLRSEMDDWCFGNVNQTQSELDEYLAAPVVILRGTETMETFNPVTWYEANKGSYPTLAAIAYNLFAVPAMSAEAERVFSR